MVQNRTDDDTNNLDKGDKMVELGQLDVLLDGTEKTLRPENAEFLAGRRTHPKFDSTWSGQRWIGLILMVFAGLGAVALLWNYATDLSFNSPLSASVEARFDGYQGSSTAYSYDVGDSSYSGLENSSMRFSEPPAEVDVVYLRFWPSQSMLESNLDSSVWMVFLFLLGVLGLIGFVGWYTRHYLEYVTRLATQATHVIPGSITGRKKPMLNHTGVTYAVRVTSPTTGRDLDRSISIGHLNARAGRFKVGDTVALLYAADECCDVL